ncbi:MAG: rhodanese-like domain-containing protein [Phycisphaerae bacterium]|nr:rhodanese-like domain-containing protein [Phycisphaerae bacterium]
MPAGATLREGLEITPRQAKSRFETPGRLVLVDVRTKPEWDLVHIPGSVHIPLDEIERRHDEIDRAPDQELAILCHHGVRSMKAALALRALGHAGAVSVAGGIELWSLAADPSIPRYERGPGVLRLVDDASRPGSPGA